MTDGPRTALTRRQQQVAELIGRGWSCPRVAAELGLSVRTVEGHVVEAAMRFDNPDELPPYLLLFFWARHRHWLATNVAQPRSA